MKLEPSYLGDGVYAKTDEAGSLILTTGSHLDHEADNRIVFDVYEPRVLDNLLTYIQRYRGEPDDDRR